MTKEKDMACEMPENEACECGQEQEACAEAPCADAKCDDAKCTGAHSDCEKTEEPCKETGGKTDGDFQKMENELVKAKAELTAAKETLMRTTAEYDNYRKRTIAEKEASFNNGVSSAVKKLLGLLDTLAMAEAIETADEAYKAGVTLTLTRAQDIFSSMGIQEIEALGLPFDPNLHSAVMQDEAAEGVESGTVTKVLLKGYILGDRVVRFANVAVAN